MAKDIDFIVGVVSEVVARGHKDEARLAHGEQLREKVFEAIRKGEVLDHYRYKWLSQSANLLIELVIDMAKDFDKAHPDDMASAQDMLDVVNIALHRMREGYGLNPKPEGTP